MGKEEIMLAGDPTQGLTATRAYLWAHRRSLWNKSTLGFVKTVISVIGLL